MIVICEVHKQDEHLLNILSRLVILEKSYEKTSSNFINGYNKKYTAKIIYELGDVKM